MRSCIGPCRPVGTGLYRHVPQRLQVCMGLYTGLYSHVPQRFLMSFWQGLDLADLYRHVPQRLYSQVQTLLEAHEEGGTHACTAYTSPRQLREADDEALYSHVCTAPASAPRHGRACASFELAGTWHRHMMHVAHGMWVWHHPCATCHTHMPPAMPAWLPLSSSPHAIPTSSLFM